MSLENNQGAVGVISSLKDLVKMAVGVRNNINKIENEIRNTYLKIFISISISYFFVLLIFGFRVGLKSLVFLSGVLNVYLLLGFLFLCVCLLTYGLLLISNLKKMKLDLEAEKDVLNELLSITFDVRKGIHLYQQRENILELVEIDMDLKRIRFSTKKKGKKNSNQEDLPRM